MQERELSIEEEGRALVERLGGRWTSGGGMCRCPAHEDRHPSLSVRPGRTRLLLHCFAGCTASEVLSALDSAGLLGPGAGKRCSRSSHDGESRARSAAVRIWAESRRIIGTPAESYLAARGLETDSPELRFHPRAPLGRSPAAEFRPAMIAAVRDDTGIVAIQRTFIARDDSGRTPKPERRCALGRMGSGAVRLGGTARILGLAEGIETALSASLLFAIPCWAVLGAERFGRIALPASVERLVLFLDHDDGGRRAQSLARAAFEKLEIEVRVPGEPGKDWNDVLLNAQAGRSGLETSASAAVQRPLSVRSIGKPHRSHSAA
jgi:hypothetical protein